MYAGIVQAIACRDKFKSSASPMPISSLLGAARPPLDMISSAGHKLTYLKQVLAGSRCVEQVESGHGTSPQR